MTCPHCSFENLDTNTVCFRCGQEIDLSGLDVEPPRRRLPGWSARFMARLTRGRRPKIGTRGPAFGSALLSFVPGLGHLWLGEPGRAALALGLYLGAAVIGHGLAAPDLAAWLMQPHWLPLSVHAWVMADAYALRRRQGGALVPRRELLLVTLGALALLYLPVMWGLLPDPRGPRQVRLYAGLEPAGLVAGDVLRLEPGPVDRPRPGTVVVFRLPYEQQMIGVVQAGPGSRVDWRKGVLRVDTRPLPAPGFLKAVPDGQLTLGPGEYLVLPAWAQPEALQDLVLPAGSIEGTAVEVVEPPERRRNLDTR